MFKIFKSKCLENTKNSYFTQVVEVKDAASLANAVNRDYVCAFYKQYYRKNENFIASNCLPFDCDNDFTENPDEWMTVEKLKKIFEGVTFGIHYSRNHMKDKEYIDDTTGEVKKVVKARPRFHVFFEIDVIKNYVEYENLKKKVAHMYPFFDGNALDAARLMFGTNEPKVEYFEGEINLTQFLDDEEFDKDINLIKSGSRNTTMSRFASKILVRFGDTDEAYEKFIEKSNLCEPPLDDEELKTIWNSALRFYEKVKSNPNYIDPSKYNDNNSYKPSDFTDVGQAKVLADYFKSELRYNTSSGFLRFKGTYWEESDIGAQAVVHELTRRQLLEAENEIYKARQELENIGAIDLLTASKKVLENYSDDVLDVYNRYMEATRYKKFVLQRRESKYISATLKEVRPMVEIAHSKLDSNPFLLCTPNAVYDLRRGMVNPQAHNPEDYITKITAVSPSDKGKKLWLDCLDKIFAKNPELIDYVQLVCGLAAIGKVMLEGMIIAYGDGGNGKSTFWNAIFKTLGLYSGKLSADALTTSCRRNTKPELAEAKGKRLIIASESQQGARLDESIIKQLCSTDEVQAEKKYKDPFHFVPCHTLVLYTNHLPRVSGIDDGIWNRLFVIPFNNKLRGVKGDIKNYADFLFENAGEYILKWVIEGAKKIIELQYHLPVPKVVSDAIGLYREQNNWFNHFIEDCCEVDESLKESSNSLYSAYRKYCLESGEFVRSTTEFYSTLEKNGFTRFIIKRKKFIKGLKLQVEDFDDFLE